MNQKFLKVLNLALLLNPISTSQELTENKPTVFVNFSGHVAKVEVYIYEQGWDPDASCNKSYGGYLEYLDEKELDECIAHLQSLCDQWCTMQTTE